MGIAMDDMIIIVLYVSVVFVPIFMVFWGKKILLWRKKRYWAPSFYEAVKRYPVNQKIVDKMSMARQMKICYIDEGVCVLGYSYCFKTLLDGILIQEYQLSHLFNPKAKAILVPWLALSVPKPIKLPWFSPIKDGMALEIAGTRMILIAKKEDLGI